MVASFVTPWCAKGEVPTGVNLDHYVGRGARIQRHCDRLFGVRVTEGHSQYEPWTLGPVQVASSRDGECSL